MKIKKYSIFKESIKLIHQTDGISCGPTSLKMIADVFNINVTVEELKIVSGTDHLTGTTDVKMAKGLDYLNFDWERFPLGDKEFAFDKLNNALDEGNCILFRTLIHGVKHWIACNSKNGELFNIADPWQGEYTLTPTALDKIWGARDYDGFMVKGIKELTSIPIIEKIDTFDKEDVLHMASLVFTNVMSYKSNRSYLSNPSVDWENSVKLTYEGKIVGCYLISVHDISPKEVGGVEGYALAIAPGYRKYGCGELLKDWLETWVKENNYNYVWGQHLSGLNNKEFWLKRRELYSDHGGLFTTIKRLV